MRIGRLKDGKYSHNRYARADFPPDHAIDVLVWVLILIDLVPLCLLALALVTGAREALRWLSGRR